MKKTKLWPVLLAAGIGVAILCSLGIWQVKRLAWKEALIANIESSLSASPISWSEAMSLPNPIYIRVQQQGEFQGDDYILILTSQNGGPAWSVVRPFKTTEGKVISVFLGNALQESPPPKPAGPITLQGITMGYVSEKRPFDPENPVSENIWYWYEPDAVKKRLGVNFPHFALHLLPNTAGTEGLIVQPPKANLRNNHLGYAITWFGLAAALIGVTGAYIWHQSKVTE